MNCQNSATNGWVPLRGVYEGLLPLCGVYRVYGLRPVYSRRAGSIDLIEKST
jgi:hypothetical protein